MNNPPTTLAPAVAGADVGFENLPALRGLQRLADLRPVVLVDTREQMPLVFTRLPSRVATLHTRDYSIAGFENDFAVERKTLDDLAGCCSGENRLRFFRELHRLRGFRFKRLLIIGERWQIEAKQYHSGIRPQAALATLATIETRFDVPVVFVKDAAEGAELIERWAWYFAREAVMACNELLRGCEHETTLLPPT